MEDRLRILATLPLLAACSGVPVDTDTAPLDSDDPTIADVDGDGLSDADELLHGCDPDDPDSDDDGRLDGEEIEAGTDCTRPDTDGDGLCDGVRRDNEGDGVDPADPCALSEGWFGCDPLDPDSDGGGTDDGVEALAHGTDCAAASDDEPLCIPNTEWELHDDGVPYGFAVEAPGQLVHSASSLTGDGAGQATWSETEPLTLGLTDPLKTSEIGEQCMFRAWVEDTDPNGRARIGVNRVNPLPDGTLEVLSSVWGMFDSSDGGWQEMAVSFSCSPGPVQPVLELRSISGASTTLHTDSWLVHAIDNTFPDVNDAQTDPRATQIRHDDRGLDLYAQLRSTSVTAGSLYLSAPWVRTNSDRGVLVYTEGVHDARRVPSPWAKDGTVPDAEGRLLALMQTGENPGLNNWACEWLEWSPSGESQWVALSAGCTDTGGTSSTERLEATFDFLGDLDQGWPTTFHFAVIEWGMADDGELVPGQQIPRGNGDTTLDRDEIAGPVLRSDLFGLIARPCTGVGDPEACPGHTPVTESCPGNLVTDGGFETGTYQPGLPTSYGAWGGDAARVVGASDCFGPAEGSQWLQLDGTGPFGATAEARADAIQLVDARALRGQELTISTEVARTLTGFEVDTFFGVEISLHEVEPAQFPLSWSRGEGIVLARTPAPTRELPDEPLARAAPSATFTVPEGDGPATLSVVVFALENVSNQVDDTEFAGHWIDAVCLSPAAR